MQYNAWSGNQFVVPQVLQPVYSGGLLDLPDASTYAPEPEQPRPPQPSIPYQGDTPQQHSLPSAVQPALNASTAAGLLTQTPAMFGTPFVPAATGLLGLGAGALDAHAANSRIGAINAVAPPDKQVAEVSYLKSMVPFGSFFGLDAEAQEEENMTNQATANTFNTDPESEQTAMLADQNAGMFSPAEVNTSLKTGMPLGTPIDANNYFYSLVNDAIEKGLTVNSHGMPGYLGTASGPNGEQQGNFGSFGDMAKHAKHAFNTGWFGPPEENPHGPPSDGGPGGSTGTAGSDAASAAGSDDGPGGGAGSAAGPFYEGGYVSQDRLVGPDPVGPDTGHATLAHGEFVMDRDAVDFWGKPVMQGLLEIADSGLSKSKAKEKLKGLLG